jgi:hypothetical protein
VRRSIAERSDQLKDMHPSRMISLRHATEPSSHWSSTVEKQSPSMCNRSLLRSFAFNGLVPARGNIGNPVVSAELCEQKAHTSFNMSSYIGSKPIVTPLRHSTCILTIKPTSEGSIVNSHSHHLVIVSRYYQKRDSKHF